jgi:hypothetical protein
MVPLVENSKKPIFIQEYWYLHENSTPSSPSERARKDDIIAALLEKTYEF